MNPPMLKVPIPKDEKGDYFRAPSAPLPPNLALTGVTHLPPPSPLSWFQNHCGAYSLSHLAATSNSSSHAWDSYSHHHQYFKTATPAPTTSFASFYGLSLPPTAPSLMAPLPAHVGSNASYLSPPTYKTALPPPVAHSHNERPPYALSSPGVFRPIPSRPSSSATSLVIPRVEFKSSNGFEHRSKALKIENKSPPIKSEPDYLNDSDSAFEDGDGSFSLCSRTTPVNHKSIKKWRQRSTPSSSQPISVNTTSTPEHRPTKVTEEANFAGPPFAPGSLSSSWSSSFSSLHNLSTSSGSDSSSLLSPFKPCSNSSPIASNTPKVSSKPLEHIPVGIALARLRPSNEKTTDDKEDEVELKKSQPLSKEDFSLSIPKVPTIPLTAASNKDLLPLGYQWAKDPLTGQIFFLPSNPIWASNPSYGYLQWQQDAWLAHQHLQLSLSGLNVQSNASLPKEENRLEKEAIPERAPSVVSDERISVCGSSSSSHLEDSTIINPTEVEVIPQDTKEKKKVKREVSEESKSSEMNGLELLSEGISRMETIFASKKDEAGQNSKNNLSLLLDAAETVESSPVNESKSIKIESKIPSDLNRNYHSPEAEKEAKAFIASKSAKSSPGRSRNPSLSLEETHDLGSPKRNNSSLDEMEAWEIGMRMNLAEIQRKYKEKYKELYKLQKSSSSSTRRRKSSSDSGTYTSKKIKTEKDAWSSPGSFSDTFVKKYKPEQDDKFAEVDEDMMPYNWVHKKKLFLPVATNQKNNSDLTLFTDKFKTGRPNPFENLLRLSKNRQSLEDDDDQSEEISKDEEDEESKSKDLELEDDDDVIDEREILRDTKVIPDVFQKAEDESSRVVMDTTTVADEEYPKESSEEKPPALIVSPLKIKKSFLSDDSEELNECQVPKKKSKKSKKYKKNRKDRREDKKLKKARKMKVSVIRTPPTSSCLDITEEKSSPSFSKQIQAVKKKWTTSDEEDMNECDLLEPKEPEDCLLSEHDLRDGLRVLTKIEGHFHPSTIKALSPPDIYGVIVDKERGNKPHIFSREEVLKAAIYEVKPNSIMDVPIGTRVCAYWSQKYNHLYPGTIGEPGSPNPKLDPNYFVNVELDDGDSRDIHIDSVRYLPPNYPLVQYEPDPMAIGCRRKRMFSTDSTLSTTSSISSTRASDAKDEMSLKALKCRKDSSSLSKTVTKVIIKSSDLKFKIRSSPELSIESKSSSTTSNKSSMAAFLPAQQLWCWADEGIKKGRRIIHNSIKRDDDETLSVGTCAVFLSTGRPDRPYIGRLESLWETIGSNSIRNMRVKVRWFYHACETKGKSKDGGDVEDLKLPGALFESYHYDENDVQTISHGCDVLSVSKYFDKLSQEPSRIQTIYENNDLYYLAGNYDPVEEDIRFYPKVFQDYNV